MPNSSNNILDAVVLLLQAQDRDLSSVSLEEAKQITFDLLCKRKKAMRALEAVVPPAERSFPLQKCSA